MSEIEERPFKKDPYHEQKFRRYNFNMTTKQYSYLREVSSKQKTTIAVYLNRLLEKDMIRLGEPV